MNKRIPFSWSEPDYSNDIDYDINQYHYLYEDSEMLKHIKEKIDRKKWGANEVGYLQAVVWELKALRRQFSGQDSRTEKDIKDLLFIFDDRLERLERNEK